jgi:acetyl-CoA carboxylase carboxyltransferase component
VFGRANIEGRPVVASADDFTVRGGAADAAIHRKFVACEQMAHTLKIPLIRMIDGTGGGGSVKTLEEIGATYVPATPGWGEIVKNLEMVPVVALALGPNRGTGRGRGWWPATIRSWSGASASCSPPGPPWSRRSARRATRNRSAARSSTPATVWSTRKWDRRQRPLPAPRRFLSYLPSHVGQHAPRLASGDPADRRDPALVDLVPREAKQVYSMRKLMGMVFDEGSVFENGAGCGAAR